MMKKMISAFLSIVLILSTMLTISAEDLSDNVQVEVDVQTVNVTVKADEIGVLTGYIMSEALGDTTIYGVAQTDVYEEINGDYIYELSFVMPLSADKGTYKVYLGDVYHTDKTFPFVGLKSMVGDFNALDQTAATGIYALLTNPDSNIPYDTTQYVSLGDVRELVDAEIASWNLAATIDTIDSVTATFIEKMDQVIYSALIASSADATTFETAVNDAMEKEIFDGKFFDKVDAETVYKYMPEGPVTAVVYDDVAEQLSTAILLGVAEAADHITLYDATVYYAEKGILTVDTDKLDTLEGADLHYDVFKDLKEKKPYGTIELYEGKIDEIMDLYLAELEEGGGNPSSSPTTGPLGSSVGSSSTQKPAEKPLSPLNFNDIQDVEWAKMPITYLAERGIVSGRGNGVFAPHDTVTREEFVKLVVAAFATNTKGTNCNFADVAADRWSYQYIATASELGLVTGVDANNFNPTGGITRENLAVILYRAYKLAGKDVNASGLSFTDAKNISDYAKDAVAALVKIGVMNGMGDGTFAPKAVVTRAQSAKAIYELLMVVGGGK